MTTVLSPSGVELPDPGDPHSRAQLNRDFTKINDLWSKISQLSLAVPDAGWSSAAGGLTKINYGPFTEVFIDLYLLRATNAGAFTLGTTLGVLWTAYIPSGWRPSNYADFTTVVVENGGPAPIGSAVFRVDNAGTVQGMAGFGQAAITVPANANPAWAMHVKGSWII